MKPVHYLTAAQVALQLLALSAITVATETPRRVDTLLLTHRWFTFIHVYPTGRKQNKSLLSRQHVCTSKTKLTEVFTWPLITYSNKLSRKNGGVNVFKNLNTENDTVHIARVTACEIVPKSLTERDHNLRILLWITRAWNNRKNKLQQYLINPAVKYFTRNATAWRFEVIS